jgi:hypothetical protein
MWEPQRLITLWASTACYREIFIIIYFIFTLRTWRWRQQLSPKRQWIWTELHDVVYSLYASLNMKLCLCWPSLPICTIATYRNASSRKETFPQDVTQQCRRRCSLKGRSLSLWEGKLAFANRRPTDRAVPIVLPVASPCERNQRETK